jgi:hypothetical protein
METALPNGATDGVTTFAVKSLPKFQAERIKKGQWSLKQTNFEMVQIAK